MTPAIDTLGQCPTCRDHLIAIMGEAIAWECPEHGRIVFPPAARMIGDLRVQNNVLEDRIRRALIMLEEGEAATFEGRVAVQYVLRGVDQGEPVPPSDLETAQTMVADLRRELEAANRRNAENQVLIARSQETVAAASAELARVKGEVVQLRRDLDRWNGLFSTTPSA